MVWMLLAQAFGSSNVHQSKLKGISLEQSMLNCHQDGSSSHTGSIARPGLVLLHASTPLSCIKVHFLLLRNERLWGYGWTLFISVRYPAACLRFCVCGLMQGMHRVGRWPFQGADFPRVAVETSWRAEHVMCSSRYCHCIQLDLSPRNSDKWNDLLEYDDILLCNCSSGNKRL